MKIFMRLLALAIGTFVYFQYLIRWLVAAHGLGHGWTWPLEIVIGELFYAFWPFAFLFFSIVLPRVKLLAKATTALSGLYIAYLLLELCLTTDQHSLIFRYWDVQREWCVYVLSLIIVGQVGICAMALWILADCKTATKTRQNATEPANA